MGTSAVDIQDRFLLLISDWRLDSLFSTSGSQALATYLEPWLDIAVQKFDPICSQDLTYSTTTQTFTETLTTENQIVLSEIMVLPWMEKNLNNVLQMQLSLQDKDFSTHSAAQNLTAKKDLYNMHREKDSQLLEEALQQPHSEVCRV